jgi:spore coat polysaccharide biosynthesis protein SpsF
MKVGIVILSRYSSSRLPGKALMAINNKKVLQYIIERLQRVVAKDKIVLATSNEDSDLPIANFAKEENIQLYRGSLENVAERFYNSAHEKAWDYAIRINGDNIFVDTIVLEEMIKLAERDAFDFISNVQDRTFPKGMSIEIVRMEHYKRHLKKINDSPYYREHVMVYLYEEPSGKKYYYKNDELPEAAGIQLALDTPEDFERTTDIIKQFSKPHWEYNLKDIFRIYKEGKYA